MKLTRHNKTLTNTLDKIVYLIKNYNSDMKEFKNFTIRKMFRFVSSTIRYYPDPENIELVMRPKILLERGKGDCDDKTIMSCSYFIQKNISTGFSIVSSEVEKQYHHIFAFFIINDSQYDFDATYSDSEFINKKWAKRKDFILYRK